MALDNASPTISPQIADLLVKKHGFKMQENKLLGPSGTLIPIAMQEGGVVPGYSPGGYIDPIFAAVKANNERALAERAAQEAEAAAATATLPPLPPAPSDVGIGPSADFKSAQAGYLANQAAQEVPAPPPQMQTATMAPPTFSTGTPLPAQAPQAPTPPPVAPAAPPPAPGPGGVIATDAPAVPPAVPGFQGDPGFLESDFYKNLPSFGTMDMYTASDGTEFSSGTTGRAYEQYLASLEGAAPVAPPADAAPAPAPEQTTGQLEAAIDEAQDLDLGPGNRIKNGVSDLTGISYSGDKPAYEYKLPDGTIAVRKGGGVKIYDEDMNRIPLRDYMADIGISNPLSTIRGADGSGNKLFNAITGQIRDNATEEVYEQFGGKDSDLVQQYLNDQAAAAKRRADSDEASDERMFGTIDTDIESDTFGQRVGGTMGALNEQVKKEADRLGITTDQFYGYDAAGNPVEGGLSFSDKAGMAVQDFKEVFDPSLGPLTVPYARDDDPASPTFGQVVPQIDPENARNLGVLGDYQLPSAPDPTLPMGGPGTFAPGALPAAPVQDGSLIMSPDMVTPEGGRFGDLVTQAIAAELGPGEELAFTQNALASGAFKDEGSPPEEFIQKLASFESGTPGQIGTGDYQSVNELGYSGLLQFGQPRLDDYNRENNTDIQLSEFVQDNDLQDKVNLWHIGNIDKAYDALDPIALAETGIDRDGFRAAAHLGGVQGATDFVNSGGEYNPSDKNKKSLAQYAEDLKRVEPEPVETAGLNFSLSDLNPLNFLGSAEAAPVPSDQLPPGYAEQLAQYGAGKISPDIPLGPEDFAPYPEAQTTSFDNIPNIFSPISNYAKGLLTGVPQQAEQMIRGLGPGFDTYLSQFNIADLAANPLFTIGKDLAGFGATNEEQLKNRAIYETVFGDGLGGEGLPVTKATEFVGEGLGRANDWLDSVLFTEEYKKQKEIAGFESGRGTIYEQLGQIESTTEDAEGLAAKLGEEHGGQAMDVVMSVNPYTMALSTVLNMSEGVQGAKLETEQKINSAFNSGELQDLDIYKEAIKIYDDPELAKTAVMNVALANSIPVVAGSNALDALPFGKKIKGTWGFLSTNLLGKMPLEAGQEVTQSMAVNQALKEIGLDINLTDDVVGTALTGYLMGPGPTSGQVQSLMNQGPISVSGATVDPNVNTANLGVNLGDPTTVEPPLSIEQLTSYDTDGNPVAPVLSMPGQGPGVFTAFDTTAPNVDTSNLNVNPGASGGVDQEALNLLSAADDGSLLSAVNNNPDQLRADLNRILKNNDISLENIRTAKDAIDALKAKVSSAPSGIASIDTSNLGINLGQPGTGGINNINIGMTSPPSISSQISSGFTQPYLPDAGSTPVKIMTTSPVNIGGQTVPAGLTIDVSPQQASTLVQAGDAAPVIGDAPQLMDPDATYSPFMLQDPEGTIDLSQSIGPGYNVGKVPGRDEETGQFTQAPSTPVPTGIASLLSDSGDISTATAAESTVDPSTVVEEDPVIATAIDPNIATDTETVTTTDADTTTTTEVVPNIQIETGPKLEEDEEGEEVEIPGPPPPPSGDDDEPPFECPDGFTAVKVDGQFVCMPDEEEDDGAGTVIQRVRPRIGPYYQPQSVAALSGYTPYRPR